MKLDAGRFEVRLARDVAEVRAAQHLRYRVFVQEMGAQVSEQDHHDQIEQDAFDQHFDHLLLIDRTIDPGPRGRHVVGVYRLMRSEVALAGPGFYGAGEYDLGPLIASGRKLVELGRSCVAAEYRGGVGMHLLWEGLADYVIARDIEVLFGVASFHGTDPAPIAQALSYLHHRHLAPPDIRVRAQPSAWCEMNRIPASQLDAKEAVRQIPALIKAYLRLGGFVGDGAFIDWEFNTIDVFLLMDTTRMCQTRRAHYQRRHPGGAA